MEVHHLDQFFRVEEGSGEAILDGVTTPISAGFAVIVPQGRTTTSSIRQRSIETVYHLRSAKSS
jgi:mannose-6-phosphate isomerase-like protein (cupin superfamily)